MNRIFLTGDVHSEIEHFNYDAHQTLSYTSNDPVARFLSVVSSKLTFKHWYCGHFHVNKTYGGKVRCLYGNIEECGERYDD